MATAATNTSNDTKARSLKLAREHGQTNCSHAAKTLGWVLDDSGALVSLALVIHSAHGTTTYAVSYNARRDDANCGCAASTDGRQCWHRGLGILAGREVARLYSPSGRSASARQYRADLAAESNTAALAPSL